MDFQHLLGPYQLFYAERAPNKEPCSLRRTYPSVGFIIAGGSVCVEVRRVCGVFPQANYIFVRRTIVHGGGFRGGKQPWFGIHLVQTHVWPESSFLNDDAYKTQRWMSSRKSLCDRHASLSIGRTEFLLSGGSVLVAERGRGWNERGVSSFLAAVSKNRG